METVMGVNLDKPHKWKADIVGSVDIYNDLFLNFATETYRNERGKATIAVEALH